MSLPVCSRGSCFCCRIPTWACLWAAAVSAFVAGLSHKLACEDCGFFISLLNRPGWRTCSSSAHENRFCEEPFLQFAIYQVEMKKLFFISPDLQRKWRKMDAGSVDSIFRLFMANRLKACKIQPFNILAVYCLRNCAWKGSSKAASVRANEEVLLQ